MERTVQQGECLSEIAKACGFSNWRTIYDHPINAELRNDRSNPNILFPGDMVFVPDPARKEYQGPTERRHRFKVKSPKTLLRIVVQDDTGKSLAKKKYTLQIDNMRLEGTTDGDGLLEQQVPAGARSGQLVLRLGESSSGPGYTFPLAIGHLDPIDTIRGVQARLNNLGFDSGLVDGISGPQTQGAIKTFQTKSGITVDGIAGPQTQTKLKDAYGC